MRKRDLIIVSILLIIAAVILEVLVYDTTTPRINESLVGFFSGILLAAGLFVFFNQITTKK